MSLRLGEIVSVDYEHINPRDRHAVGLLKGVLIVGQNWQSIYGFSLDMVEQLLAKLQEAENMEKAWKCHAPTRLLAKKRILLS